MCVCVCVCVCVGNKLRVYQTVLSFTEFLFSSVLFLCRVLFTLKDTKFSAVHMCAWHKVCKLRKTN